MKNRIPIPPASVLHKLFLYKKGVLYKREGGEKVGWVDAQGYVVVSVLRKQLKAHRVIWRMHHPTGKMPKILDHIDGNKQNNLLSNLRVSTHSANRKNYRPQEKPIPRPGNKLAAALGDSHD